MASTYMDHPELKAARLAEIMYLLTMVTVNFGDFYVRRQLFIPSSGLPIITFEVLLGFWLLLKGIQGSEFKSAT